jgi:flagellar hook assembly protein FlgD
VGVQDGIEMSFGIKLTAYPNPFNSSILFCYSLQNAEGGDLGIYTIQGQLLKTYDIKGKEGKIEWDARDAEGNKVSSGIYFAKARFGSKATSASQESQAIKLIYLK